jgi:hypothetical protein
MILARTEWYAVNGGSESNAYAERVCGEKRAHPAKETASAEQLRRKLRRFSAAAGTQSGCRMGTRGHFDGRHVRKPDAAQQIRKAWIGA